LLYIELDPETVYAQLVMLEISKYAYLVQGAVI